MNLPDIVAFDRGGACWQLRDRAVLRRAHGDGSSPELTVAVYSREDTFRPDGDRLRCPGGLPESLGAVRFAAGVAGNYQAMKLLGAGGGLG